MDFIKHMTNDMRDAYHEQVELMRQEVKLCEENIKKVKPFAHMGLPYTNEDGLPVVHGCRMIFIGQKDYWNHRRVEACFRLRTMTGEDWTYGSPDNPDFMP